MTATNNHEMTTQEGGSLDATASALVPYRLTKDEFELRIVPPIQRERRAAIRALEAALWAGDFAGTGYEKITPEHEMEQAENLFTPGIYVRTVHLPAGLRVVGKRHAQEHISIVSCGRALSALYEGETGALGDESRAGAALRTGRAQADAASYQMAGTALTAASQTNTKYSDAKAKK